MKSILHWLKFDKENRNFYKRESLLLRFFAMTIFWGRAWQHLFWDIPFRTFFWDESLLTPILNFFGSTWDAYISDMRIAFWQESIVQLIGVFYFALGILVYFATRERKWIKYLLWLGSFLLFCLSLLYWKEQFYRIGQLIEYTIQWFTPILLIVAVYHLPNNFNFRLILKTAIALTFIGHGLYAFGAYPIPGSFMEMTVDGFRLNDDEARYLLKIAGVLDFAAAFSLFLPYVHKPALLYCIVWGFATAFARIVVNFDYQFPIETTHQWLHETIYRLPHGGVPLLLFVLLSGSKSPLFSRD